MPNESSWFQTLKKLLPNLRTVGTELGFHIPPNLGELYNRVAQYNSPDRTPIIVIPGFLGSVLQDLPTHKKVWGEFSSQAIQPATPDGARLFSIPMRLGVPLRDLTDTVIATDTLAHIGGDILGVPLHLSAYSQLMMSLGVVGGFRDQQLALAGAVNYGSDHFTCFQFAYDWRRDIVESAQQLYDFVQSRCEFVRQKNQEVFGYQQSTVKINIVAHSMGGLVTRYFLRYGNADLPADGSLPPVTWAGAKLVNKVVLVGTPNGGALEALEDLLTGSHFPIGFPKYEASLLGTLPAVYQLLPRLRHRPVVLKQDPSQTIDIFDPRIWEQYQWGLMNPLQEEILKWLLPEASRQDRHTIALDHLTKVLTRARHLHAALDQPAPPPPDLTLQLVASDSVSTPAVAEVDAKTGKLSVIETAPGDGTVLRRNALLDERTDSNWTPTLQSPIRWDRVTFLFTDHLGLTKDPTFIDNLLFELLEQ